MDKQPIIAGNVLSVFAVNVKGKVTNSKGEPIGGVSVQEKGTNNGTVTKDDGTFSLDVRQQQCGAGF